MVIKSFCVESALSFQVFLVLFIPTKHMTKMISRVFPSFDSNCHTCLPSYLNTCGCTSDWVKLGGLKEAILCPQGQIAGSQRVAMISRTGWLAGQSFVEGDDYIVGMCDDPSLARWLIYLDVNCRHRPLLRKLDFLRGASNKSPASFFLPVLSFYCSSLSLSAFNIPSMDEVWVKKLQKVEDGKMMVKLLIKYWCTPARRRLKETRSGTGGTAAALALISASVSDYWTNVEETWLFDRRHWTHTSRMNVLETGKCVRMETVVDPL